MRRAISRLVEDALAEAILAETVTAGDTALLDLDEAGQVKVIAKHPQEQREPALVGAGR